MSDTCLLTMRVRRQDLRKLSEATGIGLPELEDMKEDEDQGVVTLQVDDASYGWLAAREAIAAAGVAFAGSHGAGSGYGPCAFAAHDGRMVEVPISWDDDPVVGIVAGPGGKPVADPEGLALIELYDRLKARAEALFAGQEREGHETGKVMVMGTAGLSEKALRLLDEGGSLGEHLLAYACLHAGDGAGYLLVVHDRAELDYTEPEWRDHLLDAGIDASLLDALCEAQDERCWYLRLDEAHDRSEQSP